MPMRIYSAAFCVLFLFALTAGCGDSATNQSGDSKTSAKKADDDPHDKPLTEQEKEQLKASVKDYKAAVAAAKARRDKIRQETTTGTPSLAHRALDELDLILEWLPEIAHQSGIPAGKLEEVTMNAQRLRELFNMVHEKIDAGEKPDYAAVADDVEAALKNLDALAAEAAAKP